MQITPFPIHLIENSLYSTSQKSFTFEDQKKLGEKKDKKIIYSNYEALYLFENKYANILKNNKELTFQEILKVFSKKNKDFLINYIVFKELRKKGYIVKTGLKFGGEFRVYEQFNFKHAKYICYPIKQSKNLNLKDFISKTRIAHSTAKLLLLAIVDSEEDVLFYEIDWVKI